MHVQGIHAILYAFFGADGALDRAAMRRQAEACVAGGADGVAVLGLATEVGKLSTAERRQVVEWAAEDLAGRVPLAVTIFGRTPGEQIEAMRHAEAAGAAWLILQPPPEPGMAEAALAAFFAPVLEAARLPVGLQNAPELMGLGLSPETLGAVARRHANLVVLKAEGPATVVRRVVEETGGRLSVLNGRGGLELPDNARAGASGMIPAPDVFDGLVRAWAAMRAGDEAAGERAYAAVLPAIAFAMQGVAHLVCYGKRIVAGRLGLGPVHDRGPGMAPTAFGLAAVARYVAAAGPYRGG
jgi:2-keto-3-deoxy-L-arabinonate dehydratase